MMERRLTAPVEADSLDLVEIIMSREEEFRFELTEHDPDRCRALLEHWRETGELPPDWLHGAPVPRRGLPPTLPGAAKAPIPEDETAEEGA